MAWKVCALLSTLAVEWGAIVAAVRGTLGSDFVIEVFTPIAAIIAIFVYYTFKMRNV